MGTFFGVTQARSERGAPTEASRVNMGIVHRALAMRNTILALLAATAMAAPLHIRESSFHPGPDGKPAGWTTWSARPETAPRCFVDTQRFRGNAGSLAISGASN